ncbi:MAG: hypothetical protein HJJLKODD_00645 [Phycisphaerae bacterium]|nr:hypothetical protein [Phycisphaerae bacterium]
MTIQRGHDALAQDESGYYWPHHPHRFLLLIFCVTLLLWAVPVWGQRGKPTTPPPPPPPSAEVLARLQLPAPELNEFILRGTIPVPAGTFPRPDKQSPFSIQLANGSLIPAQTEVVTRRPGAGVDADVVEILARVPRPSGVAAGEMIDYDVVLAPHDEPAMKLTDAVAHLAGNPGKLMVSARDIFGNVYLLDLLHQNNEFQVLRQGSTAIQICSYGTMLPIQPKSGPTATLPHLFGVHAYMTAYLNENVVLLDLRFNNGPSGADTTTTIDDPLGKMYFLDLYLIVPANWNAHLDVTDPQLGAPWTYQNLKAIPLVKPNDDGTSQVIGAQGQFHRRMVLAPASATASAQAYARQEGLGFAGWGFNNQGQELYSWWNPETARYFGQKHTLPSLDYYGATKLWDELSGDWAWAQEIVESGGMGYPINVPNLGWAHPWGSAYGGMTGGEGITLYDGVKLAYSANPDGYLYFQLAHRMHTDRQPIVLYNADGHPARLAQFLKTDSKGNLYFPGEFFQTPSSKGDPFGYKTAPKFQADYAAAAGLQPAYEAELLEFQPHDFQHYCRYTTNAKVLVYLGNDALAKDDLRMSAEAFRFSYHQYFNTAYQGAQGYSIKAGLQFAAQYPGMGLDFGRGQAWGLDAMNMAYALNDDEWRDEAQPWFELMVDMLADVQIPCNGVIHTNVYSKLFDNKYRARQTWEDVLTQSSLMGTYHTVFEDSGTAEESLLQQIITDSFYSIINPLYWPAGQGGYVIHHAVGPLDLNQPLYCDALPADGTEGGIDNFYMWSNLAYAYEWTGDKTFLQKAVEAGGGTMAGLKSKLYYTGYTQNIYNQAALTALMQDLNWVLP